MHVVRAIGSPSLVAQGTPLMKSSWAPLPQIVLQRLALLQVPGSPKVTWKSMKIWTRRKIVKVNWSILQPSCTIEFVGPRIHKLTRPVSCVHGSRNRFKKKLSLRMSKSECFRRNLKLGQLKTTHMPSNVMCLWNFTRTLGTNFIIYRREIMHNGGWCAGNWWCPWWHEVKWIATVQSVASIKVFGFTWELCENYPYKSASLGRLEFGTLAPLDLTTSFLFSDRELHKNA